MLTARTESTDEVVGLEIGADDYMRKPYNSNVLVTRIKLLLKKHSGSATGKTGILKTGFLTMDPVRQKVFVEEAEVKLTTTQFKILYFLMQNPGSLFTREQVLNGAWKGRTGITARSVDVHLTGSAKGLKPRVLISKRSGAPVTGSRNFHNPPRGTPLLLFSFQYSIFCIAYSRKKSKESTVEP